jgi:hypothetical protein
MIPEEDSAFRKLFPGQAEANFARYLEHTLENYEWICGDPKRHSDWQDS